MKEKQKKRKEIKTQKERVKKKNLRWEKKKK